MSEDTSYKLRFRNLMKRLRRELGHQRELFERNYPYNSVVNFEKLDEVVSELEDLEEEAILDKIFGE